MVSGLPSPPTAGWAGELAHARAVPHAASPTCPRLVRYTRGAARGAATESHCRWRRAAPRAWPMPTPESGATRMPASVLVVMRRPVSGLERNGQIDRAAGLPPIIVFEKTYRLVW